MTNPQNPKDNNESGQDGDLPAVSGVPADAAAQDSESGEPAQDDGSRFYPLALSTPAARRRALLNKVFTKAADISGRMAVSGVLKIAGVSLAVGAGASALGAAAAGVVLAGAGSAVYTYGRETYTEYRARREKGENVTFFNVLRQNNQQRMRRTLTSLATGVAFGALGGWLAQSDALQWTVEKAGPVVKGWLSAAAGFFGLGGAPDVVPVEAVVAAPVVSVVPPAIDIPLPEVTVPDVTVPDLAPAVAAVDVAADPLAAGLAQAQIPDLDSAMAWQLKDAAHDILRMDTIDAADRIAMARALAQEAAERGYPQAVSFLTDLPKVEAAWGLPVSDVPVPDVPVPDVPVAAAPVDVAPAAPAEVSPVVAEPVVAEPAPVEPVAADVAAPGATPEAVPVAGEAVAPVDVAPAGAATVLPDIVLGGGDVAAPVAPVVAAPAPVAVQAMPSLTPRFAAEAALCSVTLQGGEPVDISCLIKNTVMQPTDYISFVDASNAAARVTTTLDAGSVQMPTRGMLQDVTISDGAARLRTLVRATLGLNR